MEQKLPITGYKLYPESGGYTPELAKFFAHKILQAWGGITFFVAAQILDDQENSL